MKNDRMQPFSKASVLILTTVLGFQGFAQGKPNRQDGRGVDADKYGIKDDKSYAGTESMPDHIAFNVLARMLEQTPAYEENDAKFREAGDQYVKSITALDEAKTEEFVGKLRPRFQALISEQESAVRSVVCTPSLPSWSNSKAISVANQLDDIREDVYAEHYGLTTASMSTDELKSLDELLTEVKQTSGYFQFDYAEMYEGNADSLKETLLIYCNQ